jgi:hypothetical protein
VYVGGVNITYKNSPVERKKTTGLSGGTFKHPAAAL